MSDWTNEREEDDSGRRRRVLSNRQVLGFIARRWLSRPWLFYPTIVLMLIAVGFDLSLPWAAGRLVDAVTDPARIAARAWAAWAVFVGVYLGFSLIRISAFQFWNRLAARNMETIANDAFARVQSFSADWHADNFAGSTVRRVSRAMWGYDAASDSLVTAKP